LAAFTAALLNNQPMGFYSPATIVKDAQRHGLKLLPVDVTKSEWNCSLEQIMNSPRSHRDTENNNEIHLPSVVPCLRGENDGLIALRMGLRYVRGMREEAARSLLRERMLAPFTSVHDFARRVPELRKDELTTLAEIGALNSVASGQWSVASETCNSLPRIFTDVINNRQSTINDSSVTPRLRGENKLHRRDALWQVERAVRPSGPLLESQPELDAPSPLAPMNHEERLVADFHGTGLTVGPHPMAYKRAWLNAMGIRRAIELRDLPTGKRLRIGGCVITRQRPGTAKGFVFLSLEDETGVANAIVRPDLFHQNRLLLTSERFLAVEGILQNQDNVISVRAERVQPLFVTKAETSSHDFH
jgi:error-prone DNA polymerase